MSRSWSVSAANLMKKYFWVLATFLLCSCHVLVDWINIWSSSCLFLVSFNVMQCYLLLSNVQCTTLQCVGNVIYLWQMNIQKYLWPQNLTNICRIYITEYKYLNIWIYKNMFNVTIQRNYECMSEYICCLKM